MNQAQPDQIFVGQEAFDACGLQTTLGQQGFRQIAKLADRYQFPYFKLLPLLQ